MKTNQIYHGDSAEVLKTFEPDCIDLTVTSPPYDNLRTYNGFTFDFETIAKELYRVTKPGGVVVWVVGDATKDGSETLTSFKQALFFRECGFNLYDTMIYAASRPPLTHRRYEQEFDFMFVFCKGVPKTFNGLTMDLSTWSKMRLKYKFNDSASFQKNADGTRKPGRKKAGDPDHQRLRGNVWYYKIGINAEMSTDNFSHLHPAPFPEALARDHILSWSNPGDVVLDCFCGSGTTPKMAKILSREYIGIEVSAEYIHLAERRLLATNPPLFAGAGYNTVSTGQERAGSAAPVLSQPAYSPAQEGEQ